MRTADFIRFAWESLVAHRLRTFLTALGIAVGVHAALALVAMLATARVRAWRIHSPTLGPLAPAACASAAIKWVAIESAAVSAWPSLPRCG